MFYIKNKTFKNYNKLYDAVKKYFNIVKGIKLSDKSLDSIHISDKYLIILSLICYLYSDTKDINKRKIFRKFDVKEYKKVNPLYHISGDIGCFSLNRFKFENIKNEIRYHWDYHCTSSPIWKERLNKFKYKIDDTKKTLIFEDQDEEEEFYETFDYEFDEQSKELQDCIIPNIKNNTITNWIKKIKN
jgi:hypothetical protein